MNVFGIPCKKIFHCKPRHLSTYILILIQGKSDHQGPKLVDFVATISPILFLPEVLSLLSSAPPPPSPPSSEQTLYINLNLFFYSYTYLYHLSEKSIFTLLTHIFFPFYSPLTHHLCLSVCLYLSLSLSLSVCLCLSLTLSLFFCLS